MTRDFGYNVGLVEELFERWREDPTSVDESWRAYFAERAGPAANDVPGPRVERALAPASGERLRAPGPLPRSTAPDAGQQAASAPTPSAIARPTLPPPSLAEPLSSMPSSMEVMAAATLQGQVAHLIAAYRERGHLFADLDPLSGAAPPPRELAVQSFGFTEADLDRVMPALDLVGPAHRPLYQIVNELRATYCRTIGVELTQVEDPLERRWLQERVESTRNRPQLSIDTKLRVLGKLTEAEVLETFVHKSYPGAKRFSLEGAESIIPLIDVLVERGGELGVDEVVIGMAHRGRLNVLVNILDKSVHELFAQFEDASPERYLGAGDVKYHLGYSTDRRTASGKGVHLTLTFNPSHLEFVNSVVAGRTRAKQDRFGDALRRRALPLLLHGDAAMMGQGIVAETLNLACLEGFRIGGTVHVVIDNQLGFTTNPKETRSTRYSTDICAVLGMPVFHVNGDDPEAVVHAATLAVEYRQKFGKDVAIDVRCYRRWGHNEGDEPRFTQPRMYAMIDARRTVRDLYAERLAQAGEVRADRAQALVDRCRQRLQDAFDDVKMKGFEPVSYAGGGYWATFRGGRESDVPDVETGVAEDRLRALALAMVKVPDDFRVHPRLRAFLDERLAHATSGGAIDWCTAELLAYGSLLADGVPVRLCGQDSRRGTFSQRHAVLFDGQSNEPWCPLGHLGKRAGRFSVIDAPVGACGVLGFEFGYSLDYPEALVVWEAQYGDLANVAQVFIDQFVTSSEDKWHRLSGLTLLLPHGYHGEGPEQSSARVERFLTQCAEENIQVCYPSSPAQLFHVLRRQVHRKWRKPLVVFTPNSVHGWASGAGEALARDSLLPPPLGGSSAAVRGSVLADLARGTFRRTIADERTAPRATSKVLLCTGKVYADLVRRREEGGHHDVAIVRLEQLYPQDHSLAEALAGYPPETPLVWVQEEPRNYGPWYWVRANLTESLHPRTRHHPLTCISRAARGSPATGSRSSHAMEQTKLVDDAFASSPTTVA